MQVNAKEHAQGWETTVYTKDEGAKSINEEETLYLPSYMHIAKHRTVFKIPLSKVILRQ